KSASYCAFLALTALWGLGALSLATSAQDAKAPTTAAPETEEEKKEREVRKVCAVAICSTLHKQKPADGDVSCGVRKTWRKEILTTILARGKITWPWGQARCATDLKLDRSLLVKAMTTPSEFEAQFDKHDITCELEGEKENYQVKLQIHPKVTFKEG